MEFVFLDRQCQIWLLCHAKYTNFLKINKIAFILVEMKGDNQMNTVHLN